MVLTLAQKPIPEQVSKDFFKMYYQTSHTTGVCWS